MSSFYKNKFERVVFYFFWGGIIANWARLLIPHRTVTQESLMLILLVVTTLPGLIICVVRIVNLRRQLRRLETRMIVYETLLQVLDPAEYSRLETRRELSKKFKGVNFEEEQPS